MCVWVGGGGGSEYTVKFPCLCAETHQVNLVECKHYRLKMLTKKGATQNVQYTKYKQRKTREKKVKAAFPVKPWARLSPSLFDHCVLSSQTANTYL